MTSMKYIRSYLGLIIFCALLISMMVLLFIVYWDGENSSMRRNSIALGWGHACYVDSEGHIYCWGQNDNMQLGLKDNLRVHALPSLVPELLNGKVIAVTAGQGHTCALVLKGIANDSVHCWGSYLNASVINGPHLDFNISEEIINASLIMGIADGINHTCAINRTLLKDEILCWGYNLHGEIGNGLIGDGSGNHNTVASPTSAKNIHGRIVSLALGNQFSCAIVENDRRVLYCWGRNLMGQLGDGTKNDSSLPVIASEILGQPKQVAAGSFHTCIITEIDTVECWGSNGEGQLGNGVKTSEEITPQIVTGLDGRALSIKSSMNQTCALIEKTAKTELYCWGYFKSKAGYVYSHPIPEKMINTADGLITDYAVGQNDVCVVLQGNGIKCWGFNITGELGNGTFSSSGEPVNVKNLP
jgi:alpha-tubulin suppressor-like RCC1 family protein